MESRYNKAKKILDNLVNTILDGDAVKYIHANLEMFTEGEEIPCQKWSYLNRVLVTLNGTSDARGIRQWNEKGRSIKKGASAFYIFVPMFRTEKDNATETDAKVLSGFRLMPVFRMEDTEGKELEYIRRMKKLDVDKLPLSEIAKKLDLTIQKGISNNAAGSFNPVKKVITMLANNPQVFLHELSHAIDYTLGNYEKTDYAFGEVVAELSSAFLGSLYGINVDLNNTKAYIQGWSGKEHVAFKVLSAMQRVEEIYLYIDKLKSEIIKEKRKMKKREKPLKTEGNNFVLAFKTEDFKNRTQTYNEKNGTWVKRDSKTGKFIAVKTDGKPWNRVKVESEPLVAYTCPDLPPAA